jgi:hypothetical protein
MDYFPETKSKFRIVIETLLITIIPLAIWICFLYYIYLTE